MYSQKENGFNVSTFKGSEVEIGEKHGRLLGKEIEKVIERFSFALTNDYGKDWQWFRDFSVSNFSERLDERIKSEMNAIPASSAKHNGTSFKFEDLLTLNCIAEIDSYFSAHEKSAVDGRCSSFIANGKYTMDGDYILGHTTWWRYYLANSFKHFFIFKPESGIPFAMQSAPGFLFSFTDFYYNKSGIAISETTLDGIHTYNTGGTPLFQRLRLAIQHSSTVEDAVYHITKDNTGAYPNDYLIGSMDGIALLELGTFNYSLMKRKEGFFVSSNRVQFDNLYSECTINYDTLNDSDTSRFLRLNELVSSGKLDNESAKRILSDHYDSYRRENRPGKNTICGHRETEPLRDTFDKRPAFFTTGSIDGKIVTGKGAVSGSSTLKWGKPCGAQFSSEEFLSSHPEYEWLRGHLEDISPGAWYQFDHGWE